MRNLFLLLLAACALSGQPTWKEFSIGPPTAGRNQSGPFGIHAAQMPLIRAISRAYGMPEHRIVGPAWLGTERYAITAEVNEPRDFQPLFQRELAERFHMVVHKEQRQVPVFVLKPLDSPAKLSSAGSAASTPHRSGGLDMSNATMDGFAAALADAIHRPVFNETGIDGTFQIQLRWEMDDMKSLEAAVKEQLGLQLVSEVRGVELLIVDRAEKLVVK